MHHNFALTSNFLLYKWAENVQKVYKFDVLLLFLHLQIAKLTVNAKVKLNVEDRRTTSVHKLRLICNLAKNVQKEFKKNFFYYF